MMSSSDRVRYAPRPQVSRPALASFPNEPRRPASTVCDTTCLSGGADTRKGSIMHGCCGSGDPSSRGGGARVGSAESAEAVVVGGVLLGPAALGFERLELFVPFVS